MEKKKSCVFCDIVAGKAEAYKISEDELSICILDIHPFLYAGAEEFRIPIFS